MVIVHNTFLSLRIWYHTLLCSASIFCLPLSFLTADKGKFLSFFSKNKLNWGTWGTYSMWHVCQHTLMHCCLFPHAYLLHHTWALKMCIETPQKIPVLNCVVWQQAILSIQGLSDTESRPATSSWFIPIRFYPSFSCSSISPFPCIFAAALNKQSTYHPEK